MKAFAILWLRGLVFGIVFFILLGALIGGVIFTSDFPMIGIPVFVLIILPLLFGILTEDA